MSFKSSLVEESRMQTVWDIICPYLTHSQLLKLCLVSKQSSHCALNYIYKTPQFGIGLKYDALDSFNAFLSKNSNYTLSRVREINLQSVVASVYQRVNEDWLQILMSLPHVQKLDFAGLEFLNNSPVSRISNPNASCTTLDLSQSSNLNVQNALKLLSCFPFLLHLKLDYSSLLSNNAFLQSLSSCVPHLESLSFAEATFTTVGFELAFQNAGFSCLKSLRLNQCGQFNDDCLLILSRSCAPLTRLEIPKCLGVNGRGLLGLVKGKSDLIHLDLSYLPLPDMNLNLLSTLTSLSSSLQFLALSYTPIDRIRQEKPVVLDAFESLQSLETLVFTDIAQETPHNIIWNIGLSLKNLKSLVLYRKEYTSDQIFGIYANVEKSHLIIDDAFVSRFNRHARDVAHMKCRMTLKCKE